jgi:hypothetical protein
MASFFYLVEVYEGFWYREDERGVVARCGVCVYLGGVGNGVTNLSYLKGLVVAIFRVQRGGGGDREGFGGAFLYAH